ncbi:CvpA family protein [Robiginitalea sp. SC105]|uniref:CvpA family protein n=1 Tax=Robiginitalea sp. SC105 TaxID=2762332 RepID=UPI00163A3B6C|nr:CvpA family protein [Robiginitalea sp. SC105]MBC2838033.1 CvpA family protein [Robiginitalea sp. SC105]
MGFLDIILALLLAYGLYKGFRNGLILEVASIIALIAGIYGAIHFSYLAADYLGERLLWDPYYIKLSAFIITFLGIVIAVHLLGKLLTQVAELVLVGFLNRLSGAVFGVVKVAVILGALLIFFERANRSLGMEPGDFVKDSVLYAPIREVGAFVFSRVLEPDPAATDMH